MDGFQQFYGQVYNENFSKMLKELKEKSTYLNRLLANKANQKRWKILKSLWYGDFDCSFTIAVDEIIEHENRIRNQSLKPSP